MSDSPAAAAPPKGRLDALTILRFGAALWVVTLHLQNRVRLDVPPLLHRFFANGEYAMTLFFVLSGVVLAYGYHRLQPRAADVIGFYQARFARIYAPYLVLHLLGLIWVSATTAKEVSTAIYTNVLSLLGLQAWFLPSLHGSANSGTWSISAEFFFYALFPALLPLMAWLRQRWGTLRVCAYLSALSGFIGFADYVYPNAFIYYILPATRLPEFMLGVTVGLELVSAPRGWAGKNLSLFLALVLAALAAVNPSLDYGLWTRASILVVPAFAWLIYELARWDQRRASGRNLAERALIYLGESSYCLFLAHMLPMLFLDSPACRQWLLAHWQAGTPAIWAAVIAFSLVFAILLHEVVEKPARRYLLRRWHPQHPPV